MNGDFTGPAVDALGVPFGQISFDRTTGAVTDASLDFSNDRGGLDYSYIWDYVTPSVLEISPAWLTRFGNEPESYDLLIPVSSLAGVGGPVCSETTPCDTTEYGDLVSTAIYLNDASPIADAKLTEVDTMSPAAEPSGLALLGTVLGMSAFCMLPAIRRRKQMPERMEQRASVQAAPVRQMSYSSSSAPAPARGEEWGRAA